MKTIPQKFNEVFISMRERGDVNEAFVDKASAVISGLSAKGLKAVALLHSDTRNADYFRFSFYSVAEADDARVASLCLLAIVQNDLAGEGTVQLPTYAKLPGDCRIVNLVEETY